MILNKEYAAISIHPTVHFFLSSLYFIWRAKKTTFATAKVGRFFCLLLLRLHVKGDANALEHLPNIEVVFLDFQIPWSEKTRRTIWLNYFKFWFLVADENYEKW